MTRGEPTWGVYYRRDTYPGTYEMSYEGAMKELRAHGDDVYLMVMYDGEWVPVVYD